MLKRTFDVAAAAAGIVAISPLLLLIAVLIKLDSRGPLFYRGVRVGRFGQPFRIFKFRTMVTNADQIGGSSTGDDDPRITRMGRFLRKYKLDELPQLLGVFVGQMSLVGPRPETQHYVDLYTDEEQAILGLQPGITDWASIWNSDEGAILAGADDPDKAYEELIRPTKLWLQLAYVRHRSFWLDVKILADTLRKLVDKGFLPVEVQRLLADCRKEAEGRLKVENLTLTHPSSFNLHPFESGGHFRTVTELPGMGATREQLSMLHTRYRLAAQLADNKQVLELACGPGIGLGCLSERARELVGADFDRTFVETATQHYGDRLEVRRLDAERLPYEDESFDVILLLEAIYFLPEPEKFMAEARRVLRKQGTVFICSANRERPDFNRAPQTYRYLSASELKALLGRSDFDVQMYAGFPVSATGLGGKILGLLRRVAIATHLIPQTMALKTVIKKLLYGKLGPIPEELTVDEDCCEELIPIDAAAPVADYKVVYAIGRRAA